MEPMTEAELAAIEQRCAQATPGPWQDATAAIRRRHATRGPKAWRAKHGHRLRDTAVVAILGAPHADTPPLGDEFPPGYDEYDYSPVLRLYWWELKGTSFIGGPLSADTEFLTHARTDVPALIAEVRRLRAIVAGAERRCAALGLADEDDEAWDVPPVP